MSSSSSLASSRSHSRAPSDASQYSLQSGNQLINLPKLAEAALRGDTIVVKAKLSSSTAIPSNHMRAAVCSVARLHSRVFNENHKTVLDLLLQAKASPNSWLNGASALYLASAQGNVYVVDKLLHCKAKVNEKRKDTGATALWTAAAHGRANVVERLLQKNANVNKSNKLKATPLYMAVQEDHGTVVKSLLMAKAKPNKRTLQGQAPLSLAASQGNAFITQLLVGARAEVNYCPDTSNGVTALYLAAAGNHVNCIDALVSDPNCNLEATANSGNVTALWEAVRRNHVESACRLLEYGANPCVKRVDNRIDRTAIFMAVYNNKIELVKLLLQYGALRDIDEPGGVQESVCKVPHVEKGQAVFRDVHVWKKASPLWWACRACNLEMVQLLLSNGAKRGLKFLGMTEKEVAKRAGAPRKLIKLLKTFRLTDIVRPKKGKRRPRPPFKHFPPTPGQEEEEDEKKFELPRQRSASKELARPLSNPPRARPRPGSVLDPKQMGTMAPVGHEYYEEQPGSMDSITSGSSITSGDDESDPDGDMSVNLPVNAPLFAGIDAGKAAAGGDAAAGDAADDAADDDEVAYVPDPAEDSELDDLEQSASVLDALPKKAVFAKPVGQDDEPLDDDDDDDDDEDLPAPRHGQEPPEVDHKHNEENKNDSVHRRASLSLTPKTSPSKKDDEEDVSVTSKPTAGGKGGALAALRKRSSSSGKGTSLFGAKAGLKGGNTKATPGQPLQVVYHAIKRLFRGPNPVAVATHHRIHSFSEADTDGSHHTGANEDSHAAESNDAAPVHHSHSARKPSSSLEDEAKSDAVLAGLSKLLGDGLVLKDHSSSKQHVLDVKKNDRVKVLRADPSGRYWDCVREDAMGQLVRGWVRKSVIQMQPVIGASGQSQQRAAAAAAWDEEKKERRRKRKKKKKKKRNRAMMKQIQRKAERKKNGAAKSLLHAVRDAYAASDAAPYMDVEHHTPIRHHVLNGTSGDDSPSDAAAPSLGRRSASMPAVVIDHEKRSIHSADSADSWIEDDLPRAVPENELSSSGTE